MATICAETNAILKLDLGDTGGIRRITLSKLWDPTTSRVSYQRLSDMAQYSSLVDTKLHRVTVTYTDEDGDAITISTDDELTDAFEQFATRVPPIVRARASFEITKGGQKIVNDLKQAVSEIGETAKNNKPRMDQMQDALESFVTMLTQAVDSLSKNLEGLQQKKKGSSKTVPKEVRTNSFKSHKACCSEIKKRGVSKNVREEVMDDISSTKKEESDDENLAPEVEKVKECSNILPVTADLDKEFIHGRHTCDGCLVTPIIGIRYHAINLPDHDLCEKCVLAHNGKDILFEPTELERDRYLQNKWKRRQWRQKRGADGYRRQRRNEVGNLAVCSVDSALKEAIRRSLQDVKPKTIEKEELKEDKPPMKDEIAVESLEQNNDGDTIVEKKDEGEEEVGSIAEQNDVDEAETFVEKDDDEEDDLSIAGDETDSCIDDLKIFNSEEDNEDLSFAEEASEVTKPDINEEIDEPESFAQISPQLTLEEELAADITPIKPETKEAHESSFSEDAEGQGDVAIAIGKALDVTANAINAVMHEVENETTLDSHSKTECTILESVQSPNSNDESEASSESEFSVVSSDEWQVLNEDGQVTSDEMIAQAAQLLGSALFQSDIISDVTDNKDEYTTATDQSAISTPSYADSVPTHVPSIVSRAISSVVLSRWDTELKQMHELGFLDEKKNVNALEHLEAAQMGVDSEDSVTVNDAVNFLLSGYHEQI